MKPYYQDKNCTIYHGDCREMLPDLPKVDLVLTDPPYGATMARWDSIIPLDKMWESLNRIVKHSSAIVLMCQQPFTTTLISSKDGSFFMQN